MSTSTLSSEISLSQRYVFNIFLLTIRIHIELRHWPYKPGNLACCHKAIIVVRRMGVLDCLHDFNICSFVLVEHSVCHETIPLLIYIYLQYIYIDR